MQYRNCEQDLKKDLFAISVFRRAFILFPLNFLFLMATKAAWASASEENVTNLEGGIGICLS